MVLSVQIIDNGCGIPPYTLKRFSNLSFTTKTVGEGTGLGLDICKVIISDHKGQISVESEPGHTSFSIWLPAHHIETNEEPTS